MQEKHVPIVSVLVKILCQFQEWSCTHLNQDAKAYHYIDDKPWRMGASKTLNEDMGMWYSAAADLLKTHPGECNASSQLIGYLLKRVIWSLLRLLLVLLQTPPPCLRNAWALLLHKYLSIYKKGSPTRKRPPLLFVLVLSPKCPHREQEEPNPMMAHVEQLIVRTLYIT